MLSLGTRIKVFRQVAGIDQITLAEKCNVTTRTVYSWENDKISMSIEKGHILVELGANPIFIFLGMGEIMQEAIAV